MSQGYMVPRSGLSGTKEVVSALEKIAVLSLGHLACRADEIMISMVLAPHL